MKQHHHLCRENACSRLNIFNFYYSDQPLDQYGQTFHYYKQIMYVALLNFIGVGYDDSCDFRLTSICNIKTTGSILGYMNESLSEILYVT